MFETLVQYLHMDGYGLYVWGSYGIVALTYGALIWNTIAQHNALQKSIQAP